MNLLSRPNLAKTTRGVPGGYILHSPERRREEGGIAAGHTIAIVIVTVILAADSHKWDAGTFALLGSQLAFTVFIACWPWQRFSHNWFAKIYFFGTGSFIFAAFHFENPYALLGVFSELVALADVYWYRRRLMAAHYAPILGGYVAGCLWIDGTQTALLTIALPLMLVIALTIGAVSNTFARSLLARIRFRSTISSLIEALHARDGYTADHSEATVAMTMAVADELRLDDEARKELADVAVLHDIGKIGIPNEVLQKPGKLDEDEWVVMKQHPVIGERILIDMPGFEAVAKAIRHEHERWDGGGYPDGISQEEIPLSSRIVLACDAYHAMTSDRPYRKAMGPADARQELFDNAGTQFDPRVAAALAAAIDSGSLERALTAAESAEPEPVEDEYIDVEDDALAYDPITDPRTRTQVLLTNWGFAAALMSVWMVTSGFRAVWLAFTALAVAMVAGTLMARNFGQPKLWALIAGGISHASVVFLILESHEPAMLLFLVGPATATLVFFWHRITLRAIQITLVLVEFLVLPWVIAPFDAFALAAVSARAFPGMILVAGYYTPRMREMSFDREGYRATMGSLIAALQARDGYTGEHSVETVSLTNQVARRLGMGAAERAELDDVALLHDVGKIGIPDEILNKNGPLDDEEWVVMKKHPEIGEQIVRRIPGFQSVAWAIRHEHERWDGTGYPDGIAGEEIPLASRVVFACDAFHAMTSDRPYRRSMGVDAAVKELQLNAGKQFDPIVVDALVDVLYEPQVVESTAAWTGQAEGATAAA